jgi:hypothetical protein
LRLEGFQMEEVLRLGALEFREQGFAKGGVGVEKVLLDLACAAAVVRVRWHDPYGLWTKRRPQSWIRQLERSQPLRRIVVGHIELASRRYGL